MIIKENIRNHRKITEKRGKTSQILLISKILLAIEYQIWYQNNANPYQIISLLAVYCHNISSIFGITGFCMQISIARHLAILQQCWQYYSSSGKIAAILAILPEIVYALMYIYALMESSFSLKYFTTLERVF